MSKAQEEKSVVFLRYPKSTPALKIASTIYTIKKFSMNIHKYGRACVVIVDKSRLSGLWA